MLHLIGAGGHASVVADVARRAGRAPVTLWADEPPEPGRFAVDTAFAPLGGLDPSLPVILALGGLEHRRELRARFPVPAPALVDPSAIVGDGVRIGDGAVVMPGCIVNVNARIGPDAILNSGCIVEHDCIVGENAHLSPGARLAGGARVGAHAHVGTAGVVLPGVEIGARAVVGAGAVVTRDVPPGVTVVGVPARAIRRGRR